MTDQKKNREVDLLDLFTSMGRGIRDLVLWLFDTGMWCLFFAVKKWKYLVVFATIGLVLGGYNTFKGRQMFKSGMLIRSNAVSSFEMKLILDELNNYFLNADGNSDELVMKMLDLDSTDLNAISGVNAHFVIDVNRDESLDYYDLKDAADPRDTIHSRSEKYLYITAEVFEPQVLSNLQKGLVNYLSSNELIQMANVQRLEKMGMRIKSYDQETMYLDSLQRATYFEKTLPELTYSQNQLMLGESKKQLVHYDKFNIMLAKEKIFDDYKLYNAPVTVINGFPLAAKKIETPLSAMIKTILKFMFLGYLIALIQYFLRKVSGKYMARID